MNFEQLSLTRPLLKAVAEQGYTAPTPIQQKAIPPVLEGRDLLAAPKPAPAKPRPLRCPSCSVWPPVGPPIPRYGR